MKMERRGRPKTSTANDADDGDDDDDDDDDDDVDGSLWPASVDVRYCKRIVPLFICTYARLKASFVCLQNYVTFIAFTTRRVCATIHNTKPFLLEWTSLSAEPVHAFTLNYSAAYASESMTWFEDVFTLKKPKQQD